ncbi:FAD-binding oxidoreductase [Streptomyces sp. NPDC001276]|uniref:FAD-binding oxidoreductase n=1 Tax=Streptomyces sp. NPDC001276 TaxID=3364555 RepID=UPI00368746EC
MSEKAAANLRAEDVAALRQAVAGPVLEPGTEGYEEECATYNLMSPLRPAIVVGATSEADVQEAVRFAACHGLPVAVKSTAHQVVSTAEGGLLITTQRMKGISVDAQQRIVRVEAGVRWNEVLPRTAEFGLAPVVGSAPDVGVVGYTARVLHRVQLSFGARARAVAGAWPTCCARDRATNAPHPATSMASGFREVALLIDDWSATPGALSGPGRPLHCAAAPCRPIASPKAGPLSRSR